ncbi:hypothetical protein D3C73_1439270 [compost metagenome]
MSKARNGQDACFNMQQDEVDIGRLQTWRANASSTTGGSATAAATPKMLQQATAEKAGQGDLAKSRIMLARGMTFRMSTSPARIFTITKIINLS